MRTLSKAIKEYYKVEVWGGELSPKALKVLQEHNMIFPSIKMAHDDFIIKLHNEFLLAKRELIARSFLIGLEDGCSEKRAALSAYAIMMNFPLHEFTSQHGVQCDICGGFKVIERDLTFSNFARYTVGAVGSGNPESLYFFLKEASRFSEEAVKSVSIFRSVLDLVRASGPVETPSTMEKKIRLMPGVNMTKEQSRGLLDLLGHIGVLETPEHKGFICEYKNIGLMPRKSRSSDWSYPVDFWKGEYGVNEEAVEFWFGDYLRRFK